MVVPVLSIDIFKFAVVLMSFCQILLKNIFVFQTEFEKEKIEKLKKLEEVYIENLKNVGEGHRIASETVSHL